MEKPSSYLVISRRYRPQKFEDLVGQEALGQTLKNAVQQNRTAHAYLFTGPRGVGKTSAARLLAKALRCENPDPNKIPCNECPSCLEINAGKSMDVLEIDAASNTGVDNIRELRESVSYTASQGKYRIFIIDEVHMLSTAAFNALLKTLEEPPPHVIFIFATTEVHKVPATILSRCQRFDFKRISPEKIIAALTTICEKERVTIEPSALSLIADESEGCMRDAQSLLDQSIALSGMNINRKDLEEILGFVPRQSFFNLIEVITNGDPKAALELIGQAFNTGADAKVLLSRLVIFFRDLNIRKASGGFKSADPEYAELLNRAADKQPQIQIMAYLDLCLGTQANLNSAMDAQIAVEALALKLSVLDSAIVEQKASPGPGVQTPAGNVIATRVKPTPPPATPTLPAAQSGSSDLVEKFQAYLRKDRPAWMPALKSLRSIAQAGKSLEVKVENDFAGKRLASKDGHMVLKQCFGDDLSYDVKFVSSGKPETAKLPPQEIAKQKLREAKEDTAVQAALKAFKGTIAETKILDEE